MDTIRRLRQQVRHRTRGEVLPPGVWRSWPEEIASLRDVLAAGEPHEIAVAFYRLDELKAAAVEGDLHQDPAHAAVSDDELAAMRAALALRDAPLSDCLATALALPSDYGVLALRLLAGLLLRGADGGRLADATARVYALLPRVFSPYGRWLLVHDLGAVTGDQEEAYRAAEQYREAARLRIRGSGGVTLVDGYPVREARDAEVRVRPGRHLVGLVTETATVLQVVQAAPGERLDVRIQPRRLAPGFEPVGPDRDPDSGLPRRIQSELDGAEMLYVPPGTFTMGLRWDPRDPLVNSLPERSAKAATPQREVTLGGFYIDQSPVSCDGFRRWLQRGGYANRAYWDADGWLAHHGDHMQDRVVWEAWSRGESRRRPPGEPVKRVTWFEAAAWAAWCHKRLPTEAEWERACLWWGAKGLHLSVGEWCADDWIGHYDPNDTLDPLAIAGHGAPDTGAKVVRGTVLSYHGDALTARIRTNLRTRERSGAVGFRSVWVP